MRIAQKPLVLKPQVKTIPRGQWVDRGRFGHVGPQVFLFELFARCKVPSRQKHAAVGTVINEVLPVQQRLHAHNALAFMDQLKHFAMRLNRDPQASAFFSQMVGK